MDLCGVLVQIGIWRRAALPLQALLTGFASKLFAASIDIRRVHKVQDENKALKLEEQWRGLEGLQPIA